jgi:transposase-like protein
MINAAKDHPIPFCEVARRFGVTSATVRSWRENGLASFRMGKQWFTTEAALNDFAVLSDSASDKVRAERSDADYREAIKELSGYGIRCEPKPKKKTSA